MAVGTLVEVLVGVLVGSAVGVLVGVLVRVAVYVAVGTLVEVLVGVLVGSAVGVLVGVLVRVAVGVLVGVWVAQGPLQGVVVIFSPQLDKVPVEVPVLITCNAHVPEKNSPAKRDRRFCGWYVAPLVIGQELPITRFAGLSERLKLVFRVVHSLSPHTPANRVNLVPLGLTSSKARLSDRADETLTLMTSTLAITGSSIVGIDSSEVATPDLPSRAFGMVRGTSPLSALTVPETSAAPLICLIAWFPGISDPGVAVSVSVGVDDGVSVGVKVLVGVGVSGGHAPLTSTCRV